MTIGGVIPKCQTLDDTIIFGVYSIVGLEFSVFVKMRRRISRINFSALHMFGVYFHCETFYQQHCPKLKKSLPQFLRKQNQELNGQTIKI